MSLETYVVTHYVADINGSLMNTDILKGCRSIFCHETFIKSLTLIEC